PLAIRRRRLPALHWRRFRFAGPRFRVGADAFAPLIQAASAALQPHRVQPFKAAPLSGGGRVPATSRVPADEAGPRAPPSPTLCSVTAERPPRGEGEWEYKLGSKARQAVLGIFSRSTELALFRHCWPLKITTQFH